ncbi:hypothetical protein N431DRAFT_431140 [Stipitochalara longipes BDJ]|nr:hypothetical protein N431DRAFT_431140 [Stipitochalara longipes BDJ]
MEDSNQEYGRDSQVLQTRDTTSEGFQFVPETGIGRPQGTFRDIIRSRAKRKKPKPKPKYIAVSNRIVPVIRRTSNWGERDISSDSSTSSSDDIRDISSSPSPTPGPRNAAFNPFYKLPVGEDGSTHFLLSQFHAIFNPDIHPYSCALTKDDVIPFAITDSALLHAALAHSARTLCDTARTESPAERDYHTGQAIRLVNKRIAQSPDEAFSHATILTVGWLTQFEVLSFSVGSIKIHLDGLEALVKSRGGTNTLFDNPLTMKFIYWIDTIGAMALNTKPRFDVAALPPHKNPADWAPLSHLALRYKTKLSNLTRLPDLSQETINVYWGLRNITAMKDLTATFEKPPKLSWKELFSHIGRLVGRLLNIVHHDLPPSRNQNDKIYALFGNAALSHIVMFLRSKPLHQSFSELFSERIRGTLEIVDLPTFQMQYPEMMLWILIIGGMGAIHTKSQWWFAQLVAESCLAIGIVTTAEIAFFLTEFFWTDLYLDPVFMEFWDDVATALEVVNNMESVVDELDSSEL